MKANGVTPVVVWVLVIGAISGCSHKRERIPGDLFYKIETGGVQCGYAVVDTQSVVEGGQKLIQLDQRNHVSLKVLGSNVDTESHLTFLLEPDGKRVRHHDGESSSRTQRVAWTIEINGSQARCSSSLKRENMVLELPSDAIVENTLFFEHVVSDLVGVDLEAKTYRVLDMVDFEIRIVRYEKHAMERLELAGAPHGVVVVDRSVESTGTRSRLWIDTSTAMVLKFLEQDGNVVSLADPSVVDRVERVDMDPYIFDKTNVAIANVAGIASMKVRVKMRPIGLQATVDALNVPGQKFTGTVKDNVIEGIFEIEHQRFDGAGSPAFPVAVRNPELADYLAADGIFETDDEILSKQAQDITAGATNAWEAATRLAQWVSDEIAYAIPGGGTARNTYDIRAGECGAHAVLLATFCRTVGIPARMVWGCMYVPENGGSFGQHGWTEVHMGAAGWIPLDATVGETDYVDSGHIRVAHFGSLVSRLNAQEFEILDYRVAGADAESMKAARKRYAPYLGTYRQMGLSTDYEVKVMDGTLAVDIPNKTILALDPPDDLGRWVCKLTKHVYVTFDRTPRDEAGRIEGLTLHEVHSLPRRVDSNPIDVDVPAHVVPYLGHYRMAALGSDFEVCWQHDRMGLRHPRVDRLFTLEPTAEDGAWRTRHGPYTVSFVTDQDGKALSMILEAATELKKN